jgi:hypothetical protein
MFQQIFSILTAMALVACPLVCNQGMCQRVQSGVVDLKCQAGECAHARLAPADDSEDSNQQSSCEGPCSSCQCICSGAVFTDGRLCWPLERSLDWNPAPRKMAGRDLLVVVVSSDTQSPPLPSDGSENPGKVLCCLLATFLC